MFGNTDLQAIQSAVRRIDAALRLRYLQEWEPEVLGAADKAANLER